MRYVDYESAEAPFVALKTDRSPVTCLRLALDLGAILLTKCLKKEIRLRRAQAPAEASDPILRALITLEEDELTDKVVIPFVQKVHPGRIEYTHSSDEAGRDIVSFGQDILGRVHILCVQVKARPVSHGARSFAEVLQVSTTARLQGVTREDGGVCIPNEVWYLTSHPFPDSKRRQVSGILQEMARNNIKFISGEEFSLLVRERIPTVLSTLIAATHPHLVNFLSAMSKHNDGRAFGLRFDRQIEEFYVTSAISSTAGAAAALFECEADCEFANLNEVKHVPLFTLVQIDELEFGTSKIEELLKARIPLQATKLQFGGIVPKMVFEVREILDWINKVIAKTDARSDSRGRMLEEQLSKVRVKVPITHEIADLFKGLIGEVRTVIEQCPRVLNDGSLILRDALLRVRQLDDAVKRAVELGFAPGHLATEFDSERTEVVRVRIPHPEKLLDLFKILIIDGPPGCGKTTLLKMLAIRLANLGHSVIYMSCAEFDPTEKKSSLLELVGRHGVFSDGKDESHSKSVLIVDALDESAFDVSTQIEGAEGEAFANVVVSCRTAYSTRLRLRYPMIALSPFSDEEREEFFQKWFNMRPDLLERARELVGSYDDIDLHTRLPLIATILVALLDNGDEPKTRADIYSMRLDLLLSRWDKARGVRRLEVDKPEPKRRFLRQLAYKLHSAAGRTRLISEALLEDVYADSLGKWGYETKFERILGDLVGGSGILLEERKGTYSFGHLSFQEYLVGEYLAYSAQIDQVIKRFGDDWWREPLNFYACIKGDITEFASKLLSVDEFPGEQLAEMISYAPYTAPGLVDTYGTLQARDIEID